MNLQEFRTILNDPTRTVQRFDHSSMFTMDYNTCRRNDGKYVLYAVAKKLGVIGYTGCSRNCIVEMIITKEERLKFFTSNKKENKPNSNSGLEVTCAKQGFQPYEVCFKITTAQADEKFKELLERAKDEFCSDADWLLNPILEAVGK